MADISTDRLGPAAPTIAPAGRENRKDGDSRPPRRPAPRPRPPAGEPETELVDDSEDQPHQLDEMF
jgi:hypothetical protein